MTAVKKANEAPAEGAATPAAAPAPVNLQAERVKFLAKLQEEVASKFDANKRDVLSLLVIALTHASNPNTDEKHNYFKALAEVLKTTVDVDLIFRVSQDYKNNPLDVFEDFAGVAEHSLLLQLLLYCVESEQFAEKTEIALNYQQIQKAVRPEDVFRDIVSFFFSRHATAKKNEGVDVKPAEILKELFDTKASVIDGKELLKARYAGHWKGVLNRSDKHIQELVRLQTAFKEKEKARTLAAVPIEGQYHPYSMTQNKLLEKMDKSLQFATKLSEADVYTLLGIVGHASSADGQQTDAAEAAFLKNLLGRLEFKIKKDLFSTAVEQPLTLLLSQVNHVPLAKVVYYETMCMMTSNLEITTDEKDMLTSIANALKIPAEDLLMLHTRHYLDSGLRGVEDSLQAMPVMLKSAHHSLHRTQEVLSHLEIIPLVEIVKTGKELLESLETITFPTHAPAEVRVALLSLVGNAMRLDNVFDEGEKAFLSKTMKDLGLTGEDVKAFPQLMKQATVQDLCLVIRKWAIGHKQTANLPAVAYYVLKAISADGVIDAKEDKFKALFFRELELESSQYVRMLLRVQLDFVN